MEHFGRETEELRALLEGGCKRIAIVSHTNPDGDAVGSSLAWAQLLREMGHCPLCVLPNRWPYFLDWMPGISDMLVFKEKPQEAADAVSQAEVVFCLDFNQISRLEALSDIIEANTTAKRVLIDHHLNPPAEYDIMFSDPLSCSTSYIVYRLAQSLAGPEALDRESAECLYTGIMTDTGNFSFSYLTPGLYRAVAAMLEKGIDIPYINAQVYNSYTEGRVRLLGYALCNKMTLIDEGRVAYIALKESELRRFGFQLGDSEGFVNYPLSIRGVKMSAMFLQTRKFIRVSLRSRGDVVDVNVFARRYFGGGGHRNAAGGKSFVSMEETVEHYKKSVAEFFGKEGCPDAPPSE